MRSTDFLTVSLLVVLWAVLVHSCPEGYYRDPATKFCSRCSVLCSRARDSWPDCQRLCPGWGTTTKSTTTTTSSTTPPSTLKAEADTPADDADNSSDNIVGRDVTGTGNTLRHTSAEAKSSQDDHKVLFGQHVTIALIGTCLFVGLVLILSFVAYKTKFHQRLCKPRNNETSTTGGVIYQPRRNDHKNDTVNDTEEANGFLQASAAEQDTNRTSDGTEVQVQVHILPDRENNTNSGAVRGEGVHRYDGFNNPTYISSISTPNHSDTGYGGTILDPHRGVVTVNGHRLQSDGLVPNSNVDCLSAPEPLHHGRTANGTLVTYDSDLNTDPKEPVSNC